MLFSRIHQALGEAVETFFEPYEQTQLDNILANTSTENTLSKVLIGRVLPENTVLGEFDRHVVIYRDPRDQFVSMLLYLFYDFQLNGDQAGFDECFAALQEKQHNPAGVSAVELYNLIASRVGRAPIAVFNNLHRVHRDYIATFTPHRARYEDLLVGKWGLLEDYLGLSLARSAEVPMEYSRVVRSRGFGDWHNWLTADDISFTNSQWGESILELGYELGSVEQDQVIEPKTSSDYVSQFNPSRKPPAQ